MGETQAQGFERRAEAGHERSPFASRGGDRCLYGTECRVEALSGVAEETINALDLSCRHRRGTSRVLANGVDAGQDGTNLSFDLVCKAFHSLGKQPSSHEYADLDQSRG